MRLRLLSIVILIALGIVAIGMFGGCGSGSNKKKVIVESIGIDVDINWIKDTYIGIQPNPTYWGKKNDAGNIYTDTHFWAYNDSTGGMFFEYNLITDSQDFQFVSLIFCQKVPLKVKFNITPANATNKELIFTAYKVNVDADTSYNGSFGGWAGAAGDEITNVGDCVTITKDGIITCKAGFSNSETIRITATTTDGSDKSYSFDIGKWF